MNKNFITEKFLYKKDLFNNKDDFFKLEILCKKVDVSKKVFKIYTHDLKNKLCTEEITLKSYEKLFNILNNHRFCDFKYFNTSLKLNDLMYKNNSLNIDRYKINESLLTQKLVALEKEYFDL